MEKQNLLDKELQRCCINRKIARVFALLHANKEIPYEKLIKMMNPFKNYTRMIEFEEGKHDFDQYVLLENPAGQAIEELNLEDEGCKDVIATFLKKVINVGDLANKSNKKIINIGTEDGVASYLFQLKATKLDYYNKNRVKSKITYLKKLILDILATYGKYPNDNIEDSIIQYGGIQKVLNNPIFVDKSFRYFIKDILYECQSFKKIIKHGGVDIDLQRQKIVKSLSNFLLSLKFPQNASQKIITSLIENPLSHSIAMNQDLTNKQKQSFYCSEYYKSQILKKYAHNLEYQKSRHYKAKKDISKIIHFIEEQEFKITNEILNLVINFKVYELLQVKLIKKIQVSLFKKIFYQCPDYLNAFKLTHYQKKSIDSLKEDQSINLKFLLCNIFSKIQLPFKQWSIAEQRIMLRNYKILDELKLNSRQKEQLLETIFDNIEPYFHRQEKILDFRSQNQIALIQDLMKADIPEMSFEKLLQNVSIMFNFQKSTSKQMKDISSVRDNCYFDKIINNKHFCRYKESNNRDIEEENHCKKIELMKTIYSKSIQEKVYAHYQKVDQYVQQMIQNEGNPPQYSSLYPNTTQLLGEQLQSNSSFMLESSTQRNEQYCLQNKEKSYNELELQRQLFTAIQSFAQSYLWQNEDSYFEKYLVEKYDDNKIEYVKRLIETNPFEDEKSIFFEGLGAPKKLLEKVKAQFLRNADFVKPQMVQCKNLFMKLANLAENDILRDSSLIQQELEEQLKPKIKQFFEQYFKQNKNSFFEIILNQKYDRDMHKLAKAVVKEKAFENPESPFFTSLGYSSEALRKVKDEFKKNETLAIKYLIQMPDFYS